MTQVYADHPAAALRGQRSSRLAIGAHRQVVLLALGLASVLMYLIGITLRYPMLAGLQEPRGSWSTLVPPSIGSLALHVFVYAALTAAYVVALRLALAHNNAGNSHRGLAAIIIVVWLLASVALLGAYPGGESHDIFDYLFRGRMQTEYGVSPLAILPKEYTRAPFYLYISWYEHVDTYGPLWEYASRAVAEAVKLVLQVSGNWAPSDPSCPDSPGSCRMLVGYITGYRIFAIMLTGLSGILIYALASLVHKRFAAAAMLAWLWNPLLIMSSALGAHNDSLMLLFMLATLYLFYKQRWLSGLLMLMLAAHVKLTVLLILPVLLIWLLTRRGWRALLFNCAVTVAVTLPVSWALYAPLGGWDTLPRMLYERGLYVANSFAALVYRYLLEQNWDWRLALQLSTQGASLFFGAVAVVQLLVFWRAVKRTSQLQPTSANAPQHLMWRAAMWITLAYLLIGSFWFQHWYLTWVLALAALMPAAYFTRATLPWLCFGALASNIALDIVSNMPGAAFNRVQTTALTLGAMGLPVLVVVLVQLVSWLWKRRTPARSSMKEKLESLH